MAKTKKAAADKPADAWKVKTFEEACAVLGLDPTKCLPDVSAMPERHQKGALARAQCEKF